MSTAVATVKAHPDRYKKDFDAVVTFLSQHIDKKALTPNVKVASITQIRPAKSQKTSKSCGTFKGKIELRKFLQEEYNSMSVAQCQQLYELCKKVRFIKCKKPQKATEL